MTADASPPVLQARGLQRWLGTGEARVHALRGVDLELTPGRTYAVVGPSGCGKSTLLYLLGLLDQPDAGEIWLRGQRVDAVGERERTALRAAHLGFVFQFHFLLAEFTAVENVALPLLQAGQMSSEAALAEARQQLAAVGLEGKAQRRGNQLSGGERQRVAVARALVRRPAVVLADEPTGNLDAANSAALFRLFQQLARERGQTFLCVTHNPELAAACDETLSMRDGLFLPAGTTS